MCFILTFPRKHFTLNTLTVVEQCKCLHSVTKEETSMYKLQFVDTTDWNRSFSKTRSQTKVVFLQDVVRKTLIRVSVSLLATERMSSRVIGHNIFFLYYLHYILLITTNIRIIIHIFITCEMNQRLLRCILNILL